jgi:hypothetical protein
VSTYHLIRPEVWQTVPRSELFLAEALAGVWDVTIIQMEGQVKARNIPNQLRAPV